MTGGQVSVVFGGNHTGRATTFNFYVEKIKNVQKKELGPQGWFSWRTLDLPSPKRLRAGRAAPIPVQFRRPNHNDFLLLLPHNVVLTMILRIPKLRKENYPERAKNGGSQFFHGL